MTCNDAGMKLASTHMPRLRDFSRTIAINANCDSAPKQLERKCIVTLSDWLCSVFLVFLSFTPVGSISAAELMVNGGFEAGAIGWQLSGAVAGGNAPAAHAGSQYLILGNINNARDTAYQDVCIPSTATAATLTYYFNITSFEASSTEAFDKFTNTVRTTDNVILAEVGRWSNLNKDSEAGNPYYHLKNFDLLSYKGSTVRIYFAGTTDYADVTTFRVDDVSVQITAPAPTVQTLSPSLVTPTSAQMNGRINPKGLSTSAYFEYGTTASYGNMTTPLLFGVCTTTTEGIQATLSGLTPGATYHYRAVGSSSSGAVYGDDAVISTAFPPSPDLVSVTGIPSTANVGQPFTITVTAENDAGLGGANSAINASVLYSDGTHNISIANASASWADNVITRVAGDIIYDSSCSPIVASDHLIEASDNSWDSGEQHSVSFTVTPNKAGTLYLRTRVTLRNGNAGCDYVNNASASGGSLSTDQQGWSVRQYSITVNNATAPPVAKIRGSRTPVTGVSQYYGDESTGSGLLYSWATTDNHSSSDPNPQFAFNSPGQRTVYLTVTDSVGQTNQTSLSINVQPANNGNIFNQPLGADPVVLSTGNYIYEHVDLQFPGKGFPFEFKRFYNSKFSDQSGFPMGFGWTHNFNEHIRDTGTNALYTKGDGSTWTFFPTNGAYAGIDGLSDLLARNTNDTWSLTDKAQTVRAFETNGLLLSITDKNGNSQHFHYNGTALIQITDTAGRTILLNTNAFGLISDITDPSGRSIRFEYDQTNLVRVIDANGQTNRFGYNASHQMADAFDAKGTLYLHNEYNDISFVVDRQHDAFTNWTYFTFDFDDRVTFQTNAAGKFSMYQFDHRLLVTNIVDEANHTSSFEYDDDRNRIYIRDKNGNETRYAYDQRGNVTNKTDALTNITSIEYDSLNNPTRRIDALTNITSFGYDARGNLTSTTNALGFTSRVQYDANGLPVVLTDARGFSMTNVFDSRGNLIAVVDAKGFTNRFEFDLAGRKIRQIDALNRTNSFVLDNNDNLLFTTNALGFVNAFTYDQNNNRITSQNPRNAFTTNVFDLKDRLIATLAPLGQTNGASYDGLDRKIAAFDALGNPSRYGFDDIGNLITVTNALNEVARFTFDPQGNQTSAVDPTGHYITNFFDALNRKTATIDISISTNLTAYDALGRVIATTNANGQVTRFNFDPIGRLTNVMDAAGQSVFFSHDENGNRTRNTDPNGHSWTNIFDELNRPVEQRNPDGTKTAFRYDPVGNVTNKVTANGDSINYSYDPLNRLTNIAYPSGTTVALAYDPVGNRTNMTDSLGTTMWLYDLLNRPASVTDPYDQSVTNSFDANGNRVSLTYPGNKVVSYGFDALNRMASLTNWLNGIVTYAFDSRGNLIAATNANGTTATYGFDLAGRLVALTNAAPDASDIAAYALTLDGIGNHMQTAQQQPVFPVLLNQTNTYAYNSDNRLILLDGQTVTHNLNGDLTGIGTNTLGYDFEDRLTQFGLTNAVGSCSYDGLGNRLVRTVNGQARRFTLDRMGALTQVLVETDTNGSPVAYYVHGAGLAERITPGGQVATYHFNIQGSTVALTDSEGNVTDSYAFDSFGVLANAAGVSSQPFRYLGRYGIMDDSTGLYHARARYFSPQLGRFITKDPVTGRDGDGQSLNRYAYALNSPLELVDVNGLCPKGSSFWDTVNDTLYRQMLLLGNVTIGTVQGLANGISGIILLPEAVIYAAVNPKTFAKNAWQGLQSDWQSLVSADPQGVGRIVGSFAPSLFLGGGLGTVATGEGLEFSHWIPARRGGPRSILNGNYVTATEHALSDPYRYRFMPAAWKAENPMPSVLEQQWNRIPDVYKGITAGAAGADYGGQQ
jgi:RHS repeat-associated protein